jgi:hypothetical protein
MDYKLIDDEIRSHFAHRVGKIVRQYSESPKLEDDEKYEATICILALQTLLTQCQSLYENMYDKQKQCGENKFLSDKIPEKPGHLGICKDDIKLNTYSNDANNCISFITHIRNALSHPRDMNLLLTLFPKGSGYSTKGKSKSKTIKTFCFVDCQRFDNHRGRGYDTENEAKKMLEHIKNSSDISPQESEDIVLEERYGKFELRMGKKQIHQIYRVELPVQTVRLLVEKLSDYLAQPFLDKCAREDIDELIEYTI